MTAAWRAPSIEALATITRPETVESTPRDAGWKKIESDPRMQPGASSMPFDGKRMIYGGFKTLVAS